MKKSISVFSIFILFTFLFSSCHHDDDEVPLPKNPDENELITTLKLVFKESGNSSNVIDAIFQDIDGAGAMIPTLDTIRLAPGKNYNVEIFLLDESKTPADNISDEIKEEGDGHQFFFSALGGANVSFTYSDVDNNGVPIGLLSAWTAVTSSTTKNGKVRVILKHQGKDKPNSGNGDINIGSTDIDVEFPILIQ